MTKNVKNKKVKFSGKEIKEKKEFDAILLKEPHWNIQLKKSISAGIFIPTTKEEYDAVKPYETKATEQKGFVIYR